MKVHVRLYAGLGQTLGRAAPSGAPLEVDLPEGATLADLMMSLGLAQEAIKTVFVDGRMRAFNYRLAPEQRVGIFPPIGGG
jgi:sulfur-carrier protein